MTLIDKSNVFFSQPGNKGIQIMEACRKGPTIGKMAVIGLSSLTVLFLAQTVASAVAIPFQILAGIYAGIQQAIQQNRQAAFQVFGKGVVTGLQHAVGVLVASVIAAGAFTSLLLTFPLCIAVWNRPNPRNLLGSEPLGFQ
jgi:cobalamin synthase